MQSRRMLMFIVITAIILAWFVVMLGAYTRLTNAGLGCPDWPGCYGHLVVPDTSKKLSDTVIEPRKAWTEMAHRYAAGTLGFFIIIIGGWSVLRRWRSPKSQRNTARTEPFLLPVALVLLVFMQAALGMWTVTLKLLPIVVMAHLLGGILIFSGLVRLALQFSSVTPANQPYLRFWVSLGMVILFCQIALGGWVSANYAGIACVGFPQCNAQWFPSLHFAEGFHLFSQVGANYQGGLLDNEARVTIQFVHRIGALVTALYLLFLASFLVIKSRHRPLQVIAGLVALLVMLQFSLGVINVIYLLPLSIAVAHNGVAALLMATMMMMQYLTKRRLHHVG